MNAAIASDNTTAVPCGTRYVIVPGSNWYAMGAGEPKQVKCGHN